MDLDTSTATSRDTDAIRAAVDKVPLWYHTLDLGHGIVTPGWFDLRPIVGKLPWPDVAGKRCLDVGTYDGFLAFELERRGATDVLALDISDHTQWDWPPHMRGWGPEALAQIAGPDKGKGFRLARDALGSNVERLELNAYELTPDAVGHFDVVVCGALMLHLRDPLRALQAIRSVCAGRFLSIEQVWAPLPLLHSRRPLFTLDGISDLCQWWTPNPMGHLRMLQASGFAIERAGPRYATPFGVSHPPRGRRTVLWHRALGWSSGLPSHAALARPAQA